MRVVSLASNDIRDRERRVAPASWFKLARVRILALPFIVGLLLPDILVAPGAAQVALPDASLAAEYTRLVRAGEALAKAGNYVGAIEHYDRALALGPPSPLAASSLLTYRAGAYSKQGRMADAIRDHNSAVKTDANAFALWARAETLRKTGRLPDALLDYDSALRIVPNDSNTHTGRAATLWKLGRLNEAKISFDRAIELSPTNINALANRAFFFANENNFEAAIADYSKVLDLDPRHSSARINRARAYVEVGQDQDALEDYRAAQRLNKAEVATYRGLGWLYERLGKIDLARAAIEEGLAIAPNDQWLRNAQRGLPK